MSTLEAALRGGAVVVLLLRVVVLAQDARNDQVSRYSALMLLGIAAYVVESAPGFGALGLGWRTIIHVVNSGAAAVFWVTMGAIFVDEFRPRWYHGLAWLALTVLGAVEMSAVLAPPRTGAPAAPATARPGSTPLANNEPRTAPPPTGPDATLLQALGELMDQGKVYREPELSVSSLSQKLDVPEYRLRRLINQELGHRNFSAFVNGYRLAEIETALGDPTQADVPILTIALDAGFGSIGPFNRAFKAHSGLTPTEYRRACLRTVQSQELLQEPLRKPSQAIADSENG
jgi:AraC-like DNA-binding protein